MKKILLIIFLYSILFSCDKSDRPSGLPESAKYDKNMNAYVSEEASVSKIYYENGKLYSECPLDEAKVYHGLCKTYLRSEDGLASQGKYEHGQKVGEWIWYFPNGKVYIRQKFGTGERDPSAVFNGDEGNEEGSYERYYSDGTLEIKGNYKSGLKSDFWQKFFKDGELEYSGYYSKGNKIRTWFYYFPNRETESVEVFDEQGKFLSRTVYSPNGKKLCETDSSGAHCG